MIDEAPIGTFLDDVASERVTPAGGTVVAVSAAMGAALCEMACIHTVAARGSDADDPDLTDPSSGDPDFDDPDFDDSDLDGLDLEDPNLDGFEDLRADLADQRRKLLLLADRDAELVDELFGGGSPSEPSDRISKRAAGVPLATAEAALAVLEDAAVVIEHGRPGVAADARAGAYLADAAVRASLATVSVNVETLEDRSYAATIEERSAEIATRAAAIRHDVL
ncbi:cyclodeaminase/cyclohydrolase family protein [Halobellus captivus]|uniref:cyclodeaminase/cyclohydrolase family protein n=1 Tax=Halobellus captivus TaxID=2592614 RepID=UPI0011A86284|nr:cyclodeaminase/cyclohydrolase family protein [Halobellus captivus]